MTNNKDYYYCYTIHHGDIVYEKHTNEGLPLNQVLGIIEGRDFLDKTFMQDSVYEEGDRLTIEIIAPFNGNGKEIIHRKRVYI